MKPVYAETVNTSVEEIIIVFKMHFDIGYTDYAERILQEYRTDMIEEALHNIAESKRLGKPKFVWTVPAWPMKYILEHCDPSLKPQIEQALKEGWLTVHGLPFTLQTEASDLEMLVRSLGYATDISHEYEIPLTTDAKMTDVPSHSWVIPTLLHHAGIKIFHIGCNPGSASPDVPLLFWWEGPDGSRTLTMYWGKYYGTSIVPPEEWQHKSWLAIVHSHENTGVPSLNEIEETLAEASRLAPNARIRVGKISDFYDILIKENPDIPVIRGDMPDTWIHGYASHPEALKKNKETQRGVFNLEMFSTIEGIWDGSPEDVIPLVDKTVENALLFDEHTFGLAISHGHNDFWKYDEAFKESRAMGYYDFIESSWLEKAERAFEADRTWRPAFRHRLREMAADVDVEGERIIVYNPLPWERDGIVEYHLGIYQKKEKIQNLRQAETGKMIPVYNRDNLIRFRAEKVPPLGYQTYLPVYDESKQTAHSNFGFDEKHYTLENRFVKVQIDPGSGVIRSFIDKNSGKELVMASATDGFGQYIHEKFSSEQRDTYNETYVKEGAHSWADQEMCRPPLPERPHRESTGKNPSIHFSQTAVSVSANLKFAPDGDFTDEYFVTYTLYAESPYLELNWAINNKEADPWPEAGWLSFPVNIQNARFRCMRTGGVVDPAKDFVKGSNFDYYFLNTGLAVVDEQGFGLGINSPDAPGVSLDRRGLVTYSGNFIPQEPRVFINLFNNQWGTNFREWIEGSWSARLYLWPITQYNESADLIIPLEETRIPLQAGYARSQGGKAPLSRQGLSVSKPGVMVTALTALEHGDILLRLWDLSGTSGPCTVIFPEEAGFKQAELVDLRNQPLGETVPVKNNEITLDLKANSPLTLIVGKE